MVSYQQSVIVFEQLWLHCCTCALRACSKMHGHAEVMLSLEMQHVIPSIDMWIVDTQGQFQPDIVNSAGYCNKGHCNCCPISPGVLVVLKTAILLHRHWSASIHDQLCNLINYATSHPWDAASIRADQSVLH